MTLPGHAFKNEWLVATKICLIKLNYLALPGIKSHFSLNVSVFLSIFFFLVNVVVGFLMGWDPCYL